MEAVTLQFTLFGCHVPSLAVNRTSQQPSAAGEMGCKDVQHASTTGERRSQGLMVPTNLSECCWLLFAIGESC